MRSRVGSNAKSSDPASRPGRSRPGQPSADEERHQHQPAEPAPGPQVARARQHRAEQRSRRARRRASSPGGRCDGASGGAGAVGASRARHGRDGLHRRRHAHPPADIGARVPGVRPERWTSRAYVVPRAARVQSTPLPAVGPSAASSRLSTLLVAVLGRSGAIRTNRGHAFADRSGWAARNSSSSAGLERRRRPGARSRPSPGRRRSRRGRRRPRPG